MTHYTHFPNGLAARASFERATINLLHRYYRMFPWVDRFKWDATSVKDRWYRRRTCQYVRDRLGKVSG